MIYLSPLSLRLLNVFVELYQTTLIVLFLGSTGAICLAMLMIQQQYNHVRIELIFNLLAFSEFYMIFTNFSQIPTNMMKLCCLHRYFPDLWLVSSRFIYGLWVCSKNHQCIQGNQCRNLSNRLASTANRYTANGSHHCTIYSAIAWFQFLWQHFV